MNQDPSSLENLEPGKLEDFYHDSPFVTIVIPTCNSAKSIGMTLESLIVQNYPHFEIIVVDASSKDRTFDIVKSYHSKRISLCTVSEYNQSEMLNKGISMAKGKYINFIFPGDFYLHRHVLAQIMTFAKENKTPDLVYSGTLIREANIEVKTLYRPLSLALLKSGKQPTSLQACWFKVDVFTVIGKFNPTYELRGGLDLFCRFLLSKNLNFASTSNVLIDYDLRFIQRETVVKHYFETLRVLYSNFGLKTALERVVAWADLLRYFRHLEARFKLALGMKVE